MESLKNGKCVFTSPLKTLEFFAQEMVQTLKDFNLKSDLTSGLLLRFQVAGCIQLEDGELNSQEVPLALFSFCSL